MQGVKATPFITGASLGAHGQPRRARPASAPKGGEGGGGETAPGIRGLRGSGGVSASPNERDWSVQTPTPTLSGVRPLIRNRGSEARGPRGRGPRGPARVTDSHMDAMHFTLDWGRAELGFNALGSGGGLRFRLPRNGHSDGAHLLRGSVYAGAGASGGSDAARPTRPLRTQGGTVVRGS